MIPDCLTLLPHPPLRDGEGGVDPAVGVHDAPGHPLGHAVDRVADVLPRRDQDAEQETRWFNPLRVDVFQ